MSTCFSTCKIHNAGNRRQPCAQVFRLRAKHVEIVAKHFERDLRAHARQHVIEPVRNRLADVDGGWQSAETLARMSATITFLSSARRASDRHRSRTNARLRHARRVRRGRCGGPRAFTSGTSMNERFGDQPDAMALGQRDAGIKQHADRECALVERRQEGARQKRRADNGCNHGGARQRQQQSWPRERRASSARRVARLFSQRTSPLSRSFSRFRLGSR